MTTSFRAAAKPLFALSLAGCLSLASGSADAAGFFDQLFGVAPAPQAYAPQPSFGEQPYFAPGQRPVISSHSKKRIATRTPVLQKTTDLMHDATLRAGDAVMMKDGIHIYEGDDASKHTSREFVAIDKADDVSRVKRAELIALDTTRNDPLRGGVAPQTPVSGRSASVSGSTAPDFKITDANGKSVRYVGP